MDVVKVNSLGLAYLGDSVYELEIRNYLVNSGLVKVNDMQKEAIKYVSAERQAKFLQILLEKNFFNEEEKLVIKNARNSKTHSKPKSCDIITYKHATALEAIIGYYYLMNKYDNIKRIIDLITNIEME